MSELLSVHDLKTHFFVDAGIVKAVDGVSFQLEAGKTLGIVGESGSGKSVTSLSIMGLVPAPHGRIVSGKIHLNGRDLVKMKEQQLRSIRGNEVAMIFQDPMTSLNPVFTIGNQIMEPIRLHQKLSVREARKKALSMLEQVGIPSPERRLNEYPYQLSGGMRQRVMIAMALSCNPQLLIADEPTTALDVTIQAQILDLMRGLQAQTNTAIILITHDLGVIAESVERVLVMYAGRVVEEASTEDLFYRAKHPYSIGLLQSIPRINDSQDRLYAIPGVVPRLGEFPVGCRFHPRCSYVQDICRQQEPDLMEATPDHRAACWRLVDYKDGEKNE